MVYQSRRGVTVLHFKKYLGFADIPNIGRTKVYQIKLVTSLAVYRSIFFKDFLKETYVCMCIYTNGKVFVKISNWLA